jgi:hypothetical protein
VKRKGVVDALSCCRRPQAQGKKEKQGNAGRIYLTKPDQATRSGDRWNYQ